MLPSGHLAVGVDDGDHRQGRSKLIRLGRVDLLTVICVHVGRSEDFQGAGREQDCDHHSKHDQF